MQGQQPPPQPPEGVHRPSLRAARGGLVLPGGHRRDRTGGGPVGGRRRAGLLRPAAHRAHHSLGLDTWNTAYPKPERRLDAVMLFLSFPDSRPLTGTAEIAASYFPDTSRFFERASYGRFTLRAHPREGWLRMPRASTAYAVERDWAPDRRAAYLRDALAVADPVVDFSRYDIVYLVADPDARGRGLRRDEGRESADPAAGRRRGHRPGGDAVRTEPAGPQRLAHETGHAFDLPDLYHRPVDGKGDWDTYVGDWDVMGSQFALAPEFLGWHKWKLGWLGERQVRCVRGPEVLSLEPLAARPVRGRPRAPGWRWCGPGPTAPWPSRRAARSATTSGRARRACWSTGCGARRRPAPARWR